MQTFLPYPDFSASAAVLDNARLGKQRVEVLQILRALELPDYGWRNHPAVRMWRARTPALVVYGLTCVQQWCERGFDDSTAYQIAEFSPQLHTVDQSELACQGLLPTWLGDDRVHRSHRSRLVAKDPDFYQPIFPDAPAGLDYFWPLPDDVPASPPPVDTDELWIVRPASPAALGEFLRHGVVGFGTDAGLDFDLDELELADIKAALGLSPGRRPGRQITAVAHFATEPVPGDRVGIEIEQGGRLLVGEIVGDYVFRRRAAPGWEHSRSTRWETVVARSLVEPPSSLQDVRPLFRVRWRGVGPSYAGTDSRGGAPVASRRLRSTDDVSAAAMKPTPIRPVTTSGTS